MYELLGSNWETQQFRPRRLPTIPEMPEEPHSVHRTAITPDSGTREQHVYDAPGTQPAARDDHIGDDPHVDGGRQSRDGTTTSTTRGRATRTPGTDGSAQVPTIGTPQEQPPRRSRTLQRLRGFVPGLGGRGDPSEATTSPAAQRASSAERTSRHPVRAAFERFLRQTASGTPTPTVQRTTVPVHGDGAAAHAVVTDRPSVAARGPYDCFDRALTDIQRNTGSTVIRLLYRSRAARLLGRWRRDLPGHSRRTAQKRAGGKFRGHPDEHSIAEQLQLLGPGAEALVVSVHPAVNANGIGAHAYRAVNDRGVVFIEDIDTRDPNAPKRIRRYPGPTTNSAGLFAIHYTPTGEVSPMRLHGRGFPNFPRNIRIGAPDDRATAVGLGSTDDFTIDPRLLIATSNTTAHTPNQSTQPLRAGGEPLRPPPICGRLPGSGTSGSWWRDVGEAWWKNLHFDRLSDAEQLRLLTEFPALRNNLPAGMGFALNTKLFGLRDRPARKARGRPWRALTGSVTAAARAGFPLHLPGYRPDLVGQPAYRRLVERGTAQAAHQVPRSAQQRCRPRPDPAHPQHPVPRR